MKTFLMWLTDNKEWLFSGLIVSIITTVFSYTMSIKNNNVGTCSDKNTISINGNVKGKVIINNKHGGKNVGFYLGLICAIGFILLLICSLLKLDVDDTKSDSTMEETKSNVVLNTEEHSIVLDSEEVQPIGIIIEAGETYEICGKDGKEVNIYMESLEDTSNDSVIYNPYGAPKVFKDSYDKKGAKGYVPIYENGKYTITVNSGRIIIINSSELSIVQLDRPALFIKTLNVNEKCEVKNINHDTAWISYITEESSIVHNFLYLKTGELGNSDTEDKELLQNTIFQKPIDAKEFMIFDVKKGSVILFGPYDYFEGL